MLRTHRVDASDVAALKGFYEGVRSEEGRINILTVSTGMSEHATLDGVSEEHFDGTFGFNVRALLFATQAWTALMPVGRLGGAGRSDPSPT